MVAKDHLALRTPEKEGFLYFAKKAVPLWKPPSRDTLTRLAELKYSDLQALVCKAISELPSMSLTFDIWTDTHTTTSYLGGTLHHFNGYKMEPNTLSVTKLEASHTADYIKEIYQEICDKWSIYKEKVELVVTDNAANIVKATKEFFNESITCFDHTLNLIPQYAIGQDSKKKDYVPGVPALLVKVREIVNLMHMSTNATLALNKKQEALGRTEGTFLRLVHDVLTRWSSIFD